MADLQFPAPSSSSSSSQRVEGWSFQQLERVGSSSWLFAVHTDRPLPTATLPDLRDWLPVCETVSAWTTDSACTSATFSVCNEHFHPAILALLSRGLLLQQPRDTFTHRTAESKPQHIVFFLAVHMPVEPQWREWIPWITHVPLGRFGSYPLQISFRVQTSDVPRTLRRLQEIGFGDVTEHTAPMVIDAF